MINTTTRWDITTIETDDTLQMRADGLDWDFVDTLAGTLANHPLAELAPIDVYPLDNGKAYVADGHHRAAAYISAGRDDIPCIRHEGGLEAAFQHALGANADQQAKPRTRKDLRKAVEAALARYYFTSEDGFPNFGKLQPKGKRWTQQQIADACRTTNQTVSNIVKDLTPKEAAKPKTTIPDEPVQTEFDFWSEFRADLSEMLVETRERLTAGTTREAFGRDPARAAEELEAFAESLRVEIREVNATAKALREGIAKEQS